MTVVEEPNGRKVMRSARDVKGDVSDRATTEASRGSHQPDSDARRRTHAKTSSQGLNPVHFARSYGFD